jgi:hypothetical protein
VNECLTIAHFATKLFMAQSIYRTIGVIVKGFSIIVIGQLVLQGIIIVVICSC